MILIWIFIVILIWLMCIFTFAIYFEYMTDKKPNEFSDSTIDLIIIFSPLTTIFCIGHFIYYYFPYPYLKEMIKSIDDGTR